jgi:hypothetical protein
MEWAWILSIFSSWNEHVNPSEPVSSTISMIKKLTHLFFGALTVFINICTTSAGAYFVVKT